MRSLQQETRRFVAGAFTCPVTKSEVVLEAEVPRPWVEWPRQVHCKACGAEHLLHYDDVRQKEPVFGHE